MALMVKSRRARSSSRETPYWTTACRPSVETSRRKVVTSCSPRSRSSTPTVPYLTPTATVRGKSRCTSSGVADVAISKSDCGCPRSWSRRLPPTHQASNPACSRLRAMCRMGSGISSSGGKITLSSVCAARQHRDHQLHSRLRWCPGAGGDCSHGDQPAAPAFECIHRGHLTEGAPGCQHHRLAFVDPAANGGNGTGRHVSAPERFEHQAIMSGSSQVEQLTRVSHHHRNQRDPGREILQSGGARVSRLSSASPLV